MNDFPSFTLQDYWRIAVRRKWLILGSIFLSLAVAGMLLLVLPKRYRSEAVLLVEDQKVPENYVKGIVEGTVAERIFLIRQQVMSRGLLGDIVKELHLYSEEQERDGIDGVVGKLRGGIEIEMVGSSDTKGGLKRDPLMGVDAFRISFSHEDPVTAMKVTSRIASKFIEENLKSRELFVEGTGQFLDYELSQAKAALEQKEQDISRFKSQYMGKLPQQMEANLRALDRIQTELNNVDEATQRLTDRINHIQKGITEYQATGNAISGFDERHGKPDPLIRRLRELEEKLASLSAEYTDSYPDIVLTKQEIAKLKSQLVGNYGSDAMAQGDKPFDPYLREVTKQRAELKSEIELSRKRQHLLIQEKKTYEQRVEKAPAIEQELLILERDYQNMKDNYRTLLDKRLNARVAENLEKRQKGAQFRILDQANLPGKPYSPNAMRVLMNGLMLGCALGFGLAFALELLRPTFRRPEDIEQVLGPIALTAIPDFAFAYGRSGYQKLLSHSGQESKKPEKALGWRAKGRTMIRRRELGSMGKQMPSEMNVVAKWLPASVVAEQYRVVATRLSLLRSECSSTVVAVTSAVKGEGKTTTVLNLGYTLAQDLGKRTVLLECDLKCPALHRYGQTPSAPGLLDLINNRDIPLETCLFSFGSVPCWILPVGGSGTGGSEILKTQRLVSILAELRGRFEYILMNTPPILPLADMNVLAGQADVLVLVVRAGSTPRHVVKRALSTVTAPSPSYVILNAAETDTMPYYMYYDYHGKPSERQPV